MKTKPQIAECVQALVRAQGGKLNKRSKIVMERGSATIRSTAIKRFVVSRDPKVRAGTNQEVA